MTIGEAIKSARLHQGLAQTVFASALGVTVTHISHLENDHTVPSIALLKKIALVCNRTLVVRFDP